ncbi:MAG: neutral zinc metallopeptidase [Actinobacteria bacterium]|nr:neutral zinc metallopeptidase [Actinomycetota bacterium]MBW3641496.1 neutral zinc metallopeptidase [Actinomycetota bacterium]
MRFRSGARLDPSQVSDRRGRGALAIGGGGGVVGLIVLVVSLLIGDGGGAPVGPSLGGLDSDLSSECRTGDDANQREDCRIVGVVNSVQAFWEQRLDRYRPAPTVFFEGGVATGCGSASSAVGPFYCPLDRSVYIDLGFYDALRTRFGAAGGPFAEAYVIAHEYGHHVQELSGLLERSRDGSTGPQSSAVRVELMADCLAGMWAGGAVATGFIEELSDADIADGLDAAAAIGDDRIQERARGRVDPESWSHGSSEQRQTWFLAGYRSGDTAACDTFAVPAV